MAKSNRDACITETLKWEGGYTNNAADPGGPTNWGITIGDAKRFWKRDATAEDVRAMPKSVAVNIYEKKYWKTKFYDCDSLPMGVDLCIFDYGVNSGPARAGKLVDKSIDQICDARLSFLKGLKTWNTFGKGWGKRVSGIRFKATEMAADASKVNKGSGTAGGAIVVGGASAAAAYPHLWVHIAVGTVVALVAAFIGYSIYKSRKHK